MKKIWLLGLLGLLMLAACKKEKQKTVTTNDEAPAVSDTLRTGNFIDQGAGHSVSGKGLLFKDANNNIILRLENFNMTAGPNVDLFLSKTNTYNAQVIKIKDLTTGFSNSSFNTDVDDTIDFSQYHYVILWCVDYSVQFGYADLN